MRLLNAYKVARARLVDHRSLFKIIGLRWISQIRYVGVIGHEMANDKVTDNSLIVRRPKWFCGLNLNARNIPWVGDLGGLGNDYLSSVRISHPLQFQTWSTGGALAMAPQKHEKLVGNLTSGTLCGQLGHNG